MMPLLAAAATATLAQDRLLNTGSSPNAATVAVCDGRILRNPANDMLRCAYRSKDATYAAFNDWTPAVFKKNPFLIPDKVIMSTGDKVNCKAVCEKDRSACDLDADWEGLKIVVKEEFNVTLDYNGEYAENLAALNDILAAVGTANNFQVLTTWLQKNWAAVLYYVTVQSPSWWKKELGVGTPTGNTTPGPKVKAGVKMLVNWAKLLVGNSNLNFVRKNAIKGVLTGLNVAFQTLPYRKIVVWVQGTLKVAQNTVLEPMLDRFCQ